LIEELDSGPFQHFWKDGLVGNKEQQLAQKHIRLSLLIAMADIGRKRGRLSFDTVLGHSMVRDIAASARSELAKFFERRILKGDGAIQS
jgi:hypothetical protein